MLNIQYFKKTEFWTRFLSRNYGANRAKNDWLVFVDSDVIVEKDYIENIKKSRKTDCVPLFGGAGDKTQKVSIFTKAISLLHDLVLQLVELEEAKKVTRFQPRSFNMGVNKNFPKIGSFSEMRIGEDPDLSMTIWENKF